MRGSILDVMVAYTAQLHVDLLELARVPAGAVGVVRQVQIEGEDAKLLCAMGLCVGARVRVVRQGEPCVVAVGGVDYRRCKCGGRCRIGVARALARCVLVETGDRSDDGSGDGSGDGHEQIARGRRS